MSEMNNTGGTTNGASGTMTNAAGTPPPSMPDGAGASPSNQTPPDWLSSLNPELKGFAEKKQFKDPGTVLESYRNLEKLTGGGLDKLLKLPESSDAPEWNDIYNKLGRPEKADGYKIPVPQGDTGEFAKQAASWFHEAGLTQKQAEKVAAKWNEHVATQSRGMTEAQAAKNVADEQGLKTKWGAAYEQNIQVAKEAAKKFGVTAEVIDSMEKSMGYAKTLEFFQSIGSGLGEHGFVSSDSRNPGFSGAMTPDQARMEIQALRQDPEWVSKFIKGDHEARALMDKLTKFSSPGTMTL